MRADVDRAVMLASRELGLDCPVVQWYESAERGAKDTWQGIPSKGETRAHKPGIVWIHRSQSHEEAILTAAHELRHVWQWKHGHLPRLQSQMTRSVSGDGEFDAREYERAFYERWKRGAAGCPQFMEFQGGQSAEVLAWIKEANEYLHGSK